MKVLNKKSSKKKYFAIFSLLFVFVVATTCFFAHSAVYASSASTPKKVKILSVIAKSDTQVVIKYKKQKVKRYQIQYSTNKNMRQAKSITCKSEKITINKLKAGTNYYIRVRAYKGRYGSWSSKKTVQTNYSIKYVLNGGKILTASKKYYNQNTSTFKLPVPVRSDYAFNGWYNKGDKDNKITQIAKGSKGNKVFYASWTVKHDLEYVEANKASCTEDGNISYYRCSNCGKYFKDADGKESISKNEIIVSKTGHTPAEPVEENKKPYTATEPETVDSVVYCSICGKELSRTKKTQGMSVQEALESYSWKRLSEISKEISSADNKDAAIEIAKKYHLIAPDGKLTGDEIKTFELTNGTKVSFQIADFYHDNKSDGTGKAGITFISKDCIAMRKMPSAKNGWNSTDLYGWINDTLITYFPAELRENIVRVDKLTNNTGYTEDVASVTETSDEIWLPSCVELCGNWNNFEEWKLAKSNDYKNADCEKLDQVVNAEGEQYKLYSDNNIDDASEITEKTWIEADPLKGIDEGYWECTFKTSDYVFLHKQFDGKTVEWMLRTPTPHKTSTDNGFYYIRNHTGGMYSYYGGISYYWTSGTIAGTKGIAPGFCI